MIELSKRLLRQVGQTNARYRMVRGGDKILLGLSGGKDSLALAHVLKHMQNVTPEKFEFKAVTLSYGMGEDYAYLTRHCAEHGIEHDVIDSSIFEISKDKIRKNSSFCSFFSRMRRGYLYTYALGHGFNKLAIAHHLDDAVESFFMLLITAHCERLPPNTSRQTGSRLSGRLYSCAKGSYAKTPCETGLRLSATRRVPRCDLILRCLTLEPKPRSFWQI